MNNSSLERDFPASKAFGTEKRQGKVSLRAPCQPRTHLLCFWSAVSADKAGVGAVSTAELHGAKLRPHQTPAHSRAPEHPLCLSRPAAGTLNGQEPLSCPAGSALQPRRALLRGDQLCTAAGGRGQTNLSERNLTPFIIITTLTLLQGKGGNLVNLQTSKRQRCHQLGAAWLERWLWTPHLHAQPQESTGDTPLWRRRRALGSCHREISFIIHPARDTRDL